MAGGPTASGVYMMLNAAVWVREMPWYGRVAAWRPALQARLVALWSLNLLDAVATTTWIRAGASELNPLMAALLGAHPLAFLLAKLGAGTAGVWALARLGDDGRRLTDGLLLLYAMVALYHLTCRLYTA